MITDSFNEFINIVCKASQYIPLTCLPPNESQCLPGWNEHIHPYKEEAEFWRTLHLDMGCPRDGFVAEY